MNGAVAAALVRYFSGTLIQFLQEPPIQSKLAAVELVAQQDCSEQVMELNPYSDPGVQVAAVVDPEVVMGMAIREMVSQVVPVVERRRKDPTSQLLSLAEEHFLKLITQELKNLETEVETISQTPHRRAQAVVALEARAEM